MVMGLVRWLRSLVGAVLVLAAGMALAEVALRLRSLQRSQATVTATEGCPLTVPSWQLGYELQPSTKVEVAVEGRDAVSFRTNSFGFRNDEVVIPKPAGLYRIVCLGDETLLAPEVAEHATFCRRLHELLQSRTQYPIEVVNAAIPHGCPLTEWLAARTRVMALQPDLVLVHITWSDLADDRELRRFTTSDRHGVPLGCPHPQLSSRPCVTLGAWRQQFRVVDWSCQQLWKQVEENSPTRTANSIWSQVETTAESAEFTHMLEPLQHLHRLCEASYCRCVVWTTPAPWQLSGTATAEGRARRIVGVPKNGLISSRTPFEVMSRTLADWKVPCLDVSGAFPTGSAADALFLPDQPRWTTDGHQKVAQFVGEQLIAHLPGPWLSPYFRSEAVPASYSRPADRPPR